MAEILKTDVLVLGAGPGGAATALFLAKENISCIVIDKATFPRDKICGDALSGKVVEVLNRLDKNIIPQLSINSKTLDCWGVTFVAPNQEALSIPFKMDYASNKERGLAPGFISKRIDFDNFLINLVKQQSLIHLLENTATESFEKITDGYIVRTKNNAFEIHTKLVIAADGAHSQFAKQQGKIEVERKHYCAGVRAYYKNVSGINDGNFIELHFLKDFLPGYFWIFPLSDNTYNIGLGMRSDVVSKRKINLKQKLAEVIEKYPALKERFANAEIVDDVKGYGLPLGSKKRKLSGDNYMLVGDAASLIDPFTGEGIGNAVMSGMCAAMQAKECIANNNFSADYLKAYDTTVYRRLWHELKLSYRMQQLVNYPWLFNFVVKKANTNKVLRETISVMFEDIDLREKLRKPSFYFQLLFSK
ncbi:MAG: geranylgeranyl reductase family protein [Bacteroidetes bacterium]|nr:geranylgeranyl reductase family protein [Bacteroidota bacterium]